MKIEININDYISEEEKKQIAINAFKESIRESLENTTTIEKIISNAAHYAVFQAIDEAVGAENNKEIIVEKTKKLINENDLSRYTFRYNTFHNKEATSVASILLEKTIKDNEELFKEKILETIKNLDVNETVLNSIDNAVENLARNVFDLVEFAKQKNNSN